jgi:hypothetical protein
MLRASQWFPTAMPIFAEFTAHGADQIDAERGSRGHALAEFRGENRSRQKNG